MTCDAELGIDTLKLFTSKLLTLKSLLCKLKLSKGMVDSRSLVGQEHRQAT